ncbi:MAG: NACHT domain-containing protein [Chloroflexi bacterium]|nr:NACHT domain-containing protein [Chloroflexota bacterium]
MLYAICSVMHHLPESTQAPPWRFDFVSALIGVIGTLILVGLIYYFRDKLSQGRENITGSLTQFSQGLQANTDDRYRALVVTQARSLSTLAHVAPLNVVFVEPELIVPISSIQSPSDTDAQTTGPYVLPWGQIVGEHPKLVILGAPGTGKTVLLARIAIVCARAIEKSSETRTVPESILGRLPIYVPLSAMNWDEPDQDEPDGEGKTDKQESKVDKLIDTAITAVTGNKGMANVLYEYLKAGRATILVDGWDELLPSQQQRATAWISELTNDLSGNLWLVSAEPRGYAPLIEAGFISLKLKAWNTTQIEAFTQQWLAACPPTDADGAESGVALRQLTAALQYAARAGAPPLELALQAFVYLSDGQMPAKRASLFDQVLDLLLRQEKEENLWLSTACRATLEQIASDLQQNERTTISREEIDAAIESTLSLSEELSARASAQVFRTITGEQGLLRSTLSNHYSFTHPLWQAYLATRQLITLDSIDLTERLDDHHWAEVSRFYIEIGDAESLVTAWLRRPDDIFCTRLRTLGSWIKVAPENASWRDGAMAMLARRFMQSKHPAQIQRGLAESLAATNMSGVTYLFKQALRHPDAGMRQAAAIGLTKTANDSDLPALEAALADNDPAVPEIIIRGLARLGTDAATRLLARVFLEGDEAISTVAAEALAQCGKEGVDFLYEAIESEDTITRRATVFGLAKIGARDLLEKVARDDEQWIVRSAAVTAMEKLAEQEKISGIVPPPKTEQLPWLISWAASKGEGVGLGNAARRMVLRALIEGDASTRLAAAETLSEVGRPDDIELLKRALTIPDPDVANAALEALIGISERYALRIE